MADETPDIEALAARLSAAMVNALCFPNGYHDLNTIKALRRRGLWGSGARTPLGAQIADHLQKACAE